MEKLVIIPTYNEKENVENIIAAVIGLQQNYHDPTAGFVCYRREVLESIYLSRITFVGYAFQIEMKFAAWKLGFKIAEVPITFIDRQLGDSKMNKGIVKEGILGVLILRWMSIFKDYRNKVKNSYPDNTITFPQQKVSLK